MKWLRLDTELVEGKYKSGGFPYLSKETDQCLVGHEISDTTSKMRRLIVPCRAWDKVSPDLQPLCVSVVDDERPGWYLIHHNGFLHYEPEYAPRDPKTFDDDTSFFFKPDNFFPGFHSLESYSKPNHFTHATDDNRVSLSEFQDKEEWKTSSSIYIIFRSKDGESALHCFIVFTRMTVFVYPSFDNCCPSFCMYDRSWEMSFTNHS